MIIIDFKEKFVKIMFDMSDEKQWNAAKAVVDALFERFPVEIEKAKVNGQ